MSNDYYAFNAGKESGPVGPFSTRLTALGAGRLEWPGQDVETCMRKPVEETVNELCSEAASHLVEHLCDEAADRLGEAFHVFGEWPAGLNDEHCEELGGLLANFLTDKLGAPRWYEFKDFEVHLAERR